MVEVLAPVVAMSALTVALATAALRAAAPGVASRHRGGLTIGIAWLVVLGGLYWGGSAALRQPLHAIATPAILAAGALVFLVGAWDDTRTVSPAGKILSQALAATLVAGGGIVIQQVTIAGTTIPLGSLSLTATVLWIVAITAAFNQIENLDRLATWLAIVGGVICASIVVVRGDVATAIVLAALVGSLAGLVPHSLSSARLLLGSSGSMLTGFVLAVTAITGLQKSATALAVGGLILIFALPIVDILDRFLRAHAERRRRRAARALKHAGH